MSSYCHSTVRAVAVCGLAAGFVALVGCGKPEAGAPPAPAAPQVTVVPPVERTVTQYEFATGRTEPLEQVELRARVSGYLIKIHFEAGKEVAKGQPLFEIDPEPYKADLAKAKASQETATADVASAEADLGKAQTRLGTTKRDYDRYVKTGSGISAAELDKAKGDFDEAAAGVRSATAKIQVAKAKVDDAKAAVRTAELNLGYCTITSPIAGIVGDRLVTEGNLVAGGVGTTTLLTTVVAVDKFDVGYDVDENTLQRIQLAIRDGKLKLPEAGVVPVEAGLAVHGTDYPLKGAMNFMDNRVNTKTGTIRIKARFDNPKPATGQRLLSAGMYTRVRVPIGEPVKAVLVPEAAFGSDQGIKFLYLVGADNKTSRMDAKVGTLDGDLRVVESVDVPGEGKPRPLGTADRVVVGGIQRVRPGLTVDPKPKPAAK